MAHDENRQCCTSAYTSCEMYGHLYVADEDSNVVYCLDCGDSYIVEEN